MDFKFRIRLHNYGMHACTAMNCLRLKCSSKQRTAGVLCAYNVPSCVRTAGVLRAYNIPSCVRTAGVLCAYNVPSCVRSYFLTQLSVVGRVWRLQFILS